MYRSGHVGVALLVFAPVGAVLLGAGALDRAVIAGGTMCWLASLPDLDHRLPGLSHRGPTHSLPFAVAVGIAFAGVTAVGTGHLQVAGGDLAGTLAALDGTSVPFAFLVGVLTVLAHLVGDAVTPAGVPLFWPLSRRSVGLGLWPADNTHANLGALVLGVAVNVVVAWVGGVPWLGHLPWG